MDITEKWTKDLFPPLFELNKFWEYQLESIKLKHPEYDSYPIFIPQVLQLWFLMSLLAFPLRNN